MIVNNSQQVSPYNTNHNINRNSKYKNAANNGILAGTVFLASSLYSNNRDTIKLCGKESRDAILKSNKKNLKFTGAGSLFVALSVGLVSLIFNKKN